MGMKWIAVRCGQLIKHKDCPCSEGQGSGKRFPVHTLKGKKPVGMPCVPPVHRLCPVLSCMAALHAGHCCHFGKGLRVLGMAWLCFGSCGGSAAPNEPPHRAWGGDESSCSVINQFWHSESQRGTELLGSQLFICIAGTSMGM